MNEPRTGSKLVIDRNTYKNVKHFNREQLMRFCEMIYSDGYNDGRESVPGVDTEQLYKVIASVPGIGEKRMAQIRAAVDAAFGLAVKEGGTS